MANVTDTDTRFGAAQGAPAGLLSRVSWGAIFAGAVVAVAAMLLFSLLGFGLGFGLVNPLTESAPTEGVATGGLIYFVVTQLLATFIGGFVAARLAGVPIAMTSALHGASVWAVTTVTIVFLGFMGGSAVVGGLTSLAGSAIGSTSDALGEVVPEDLPQVRMPEIGMRDLPQPVRQTLEAQNVSPDQLRSAVGNAFRDVLGQEEQERLRGELRSTAQEIIRTPGDVQQDLRDLRASVIGAEDAAITEQDLEEARSTLQRELGISQQETQAIVDTVRSRVEAALDRLTSAIEQARQQAIDAARTAMDTVSTASLSAFVASLLGLAAAVGGGLVGRPKRPMVANG
ncbi:MAG: hypothetical protein ACFBWO_01605 [Paracoccaceae bacterium]